MTDRANDVFAGLLPIPAVTMSDATSPKNATQCNSVSEIDLILATVEKFGVRLTTKKIAAMRSVQLIKKVLRAKEAADV